MMRRGQLEREWESDTFAGLEELRRTPDGPRWPAALEPPAPDRPALVASALPAFEQLELVVAARLA